MDNITAFGKLISDQTRLKIIKLLSIRPLCVCEMMDILRLNQPCISQHLAILKYHNLLKSRRDGKWIVYAVDKKVLGRYLNKISHFLEGSMSHVAELQKEHKRLKELKSRVVLCKKCR
ncbi:MAG: metalloregulator ArsR/SmtB family transcription factor [Candidatus Brocadiia bacterium]